MSRTADFAGRERRAQAAFLEQGVPAAARCERTSYCVKPDQMLLNLSPVIRTQAEAYFGPPRNISWHRHARSGVSSQVCCLNFLMPLATRPEILGEVIGHALGRPPLRMLPVEQGPDDEPFFVAFEWIGRANYLNEWPKSKLPNRGANVTSTDAMVRFEQDGRVETVLIEWKLIERYGQPPRAASEPERVRRYTGRMFAPDGPIRADLGLKVHDLFWEPTYQMVRQQMLAFNMQRHREDGAGRVRVLHVSPGGNRALHKVSAPALRDLGDDVFEVHKSMLVRPEDFVSVTIEDMFQTALDKYAGEEWADYLQHRYRFMSDERSA